MPSIFFLPNHFCSKTKLLSFLNHGLPCNFHHQSFFFQNKRRNQTNHPKNHRKNHPKMIQAINSFATTATNVAGVSGSPVKPNFWKPWAKFVKEPAVSLAVGGREGVGFGKGVGKVLFFLFFAFFGGFGKVFGVLGFCFFFYFLLYCCCLLVEVFFFGIVWV